MAFPAIDHDSSHGEWRIPLEAHGLEANCTAKLSKKSPLLSRGVLTKRRFGSCHSRNWPNRILDGVPDTAALPAEPGIRTADPDFSGA